MSTDIGALEKQYEKLRRKQHHACVVISGIKPARADTDVKLESDNLASSNMVGFSGHDDNQVEGSVALLTLSVPMETKTSHKDLTDPLSPTIFGDTKCFFVQNLKKKKMKEKHHTKHSKRSDKHENKMSADNSDAGEDGAETKPYHDDSTVNDSGMKGKKVCFSDEIKTIDEPGTEVEASVDHSDQNGETDKENGSGSNEDKDTDHHLENEKVDSNVKDYSAEKTCLNSVSKENVNTVSKADSASDNTETGASHDDSQSEQNSQDRVEQMEAASGCDIIETIQSKKREAKNNRNTAEADSIDTPPELHSNVLKTSRTQGLRNPSVKYCKQYYPSSHISHKKQRTKSESVENSNKQSIYQHFTMTKRQLSLDSALSGESKKAMPTKSLEFPFPVHSINEHKIKAGMKLGLYDQKALEKLEKTRKIPKTKLPHLTTD